MVSLQTVTIAVIIPGLMLAAIGFLVWLMLRRTPKEGLFGLFAFAAFALAVQLPTVWVGLTLYDAIAPPQNPAHVNWGRVLAAGGSAGIGGIICKTIKYLWGKSTANAPEKQLQQAGGKTDAD